MVIKELPLGLKGRVFTGPMPWGLFDPRGESFTDFQRESVDTIVMLTEDSESMDFAGFNLREYYMEKGFEVYHLPLRDFSIPPAGFFDKAVETIIDEAAKGRNVAVHCHAGLGRTGMLVGLLAGRVLSLAGADVVGWVRKNIVGALPDIEQARYVISAVDDK